MNGRVFVCGPITHALTTTGLDEGLVRFLSLVHDALEDGGLSVDSAHRLERWGRDSQLLDPADIARRDFAWAGASDAVVIVFEVPDQRLPWRSDGSYVELGWASALGKPVVLISRMDINQSLLVRGLSVVFDRVRVLPPELVRERPETILETLADLLESASDRPSSLTTSR